MQLNLSLAEDRKLNLQNEIFERIRLMILDGRIKPGEALPATRTMSTQLQVSRNTMTIAYDRLRAEGYIETRRSVGTFVSSQLPDSALYTPAAASSTSAAHHKSAELMLAAPPLRSQAIVNPHHNKLTVDFWVGRPDPHSFPLKAWSQLIAKRLLAPGSNLTEYRDPCGVVEFREQIARHVRRARGIIATRDDVFVIGGCQDGLNLICRLLVKEGTSAVIETPCYQGAAFLFESFRAKLHPVPVDEKGIRVDQLPGVKNAIVYVTPSHQYPLGVTLSLERRLELLNWASQTGSYIVEDDYDSDFRYHGSPLTALKGLDRSDRVIYLGTFSKCMGAGLRLGYAILPSAMRDAGRHMKALMNNGQPWLEQAALSDFMSNGSYVHHLRRIRRRYMARRDALLEALNRHFGECRTLGAPAGMHLAWQLPDKLPAAADIARAALARGVGVYTPTSGGSTFLGEDLRGDRIVILGFSSLTEKEIETGIARLAVAIKDMMS
jgi:GntR family transcriptional regulator/MocR family aminotransferase